MALDWRDTLRTLRTQFEAKAANSAGLYHLFTEVTDDERDKMTGPPWLPSFDKKPRIVDGKIIHDTWDCSSFGGLPGIEPGFRAVGEGEDITSVPDDKIVRDRSGTAQAIFVPMKLRSGFYCGPGAELIKQFKSLASMAASALAAANDLGNHPFAPDLADLFRPPRGGVRYVFGEVPEHPKQFISRGWNAGVLQFDQGVLVDVPISEHAPDDGHWLLLLHRLGWRAIRESMIRSKRFSWEGYSEVEFESLQRGYWDEDPTFAEHFSKYSRQSFYSVLGTKEVPDDLFLTSAFAINLLLSQLSDETQPASEKGASVDYSGQTWFKRTIPVPKSVSKDECTDEARVGIVVATEVEREAVLKRLSPPKGRRAISQVFAGNNTYFLGRLGSSDVVLCMCAMGSVSRDASTIVTQELIDQWNIAGLIMVGIAFGKDAAFQRIGQVLISDRIIPYEPQRIGEDQLQHRGIQMSAGSVLLNRFRNVIGWSFCDPNGNSCGYQIGPIVSGEKLVDNADFKRQLFEGHPTAIGGEMEGSGFAAAAERKRKEWIVIKAICDWGDGSKSKIHQGFVVAAAIHLVEHVLNQVGALDGLSK